MKLSRAQNEMLRDCAQAEAKGETLAVDRFTAPTVSALARNGLVNAMKVGKIGAMRVSLTGDGRAALLAWDEKVRPKDEP